MVQVQTYLEQVTNELNENETLRAECDVLREERDELVRLMTLKDDQLNTVSEEKVRLPPPLCLLLWIYISLTCYPSLSLKP